MTRCHPPTWTLPGSWFTVQSQLTLPRALGETGRHHSPFEVEEAEKPEMPCNLLKVAHGQ